MVKKIAYFFIFLTVSLSSYAHNYYFSFAEVEYNDFCGCVETSITVTTHDFEQALRKQNFLNKDLQTSLQDYKLKFQIEKFINQGFKLSMNGQLVELKLDGNEIALNGLTTFYLSSQPVSLSNEINCHFDLMMNDFPDQQNKLTFILRGQKTTLNFIQTQKTQIIKTEK